MPERVSRAVGPIPLERALLPDSLHQFGLNSHLMLEPEPTTRPYLSHHSVHSLIDGLGSPRPWTGGHSPNAADARISSNARTPTDKAGLRRAVILVSPGYSHILRSTLGYMDQEVHDCTSTRVQGSESTRRQRRSS